MVMLAQPRFLLVAEHAVLVEFADEFDDRAHEAVLALDQAIEESEIAGLVEVVPALVNLLVRFDPFTTDHERVQAEVTDVLVGARRRERAPVVHNVAVRYGSEAGPDLDSVADACGLSAEEAIAAHSGARYRVMMYGFAPGYAYLDGVPEALRLPRKPVPVRDVPAGSVLIAGPQCLVTTLDMPTGWWVIGRSEVEILGDDPDQPYLFGLGDQVRFRPVPS